MNAVCYFKLLPKRVLNKPLSSYRNLCLSRRILSSLPESKGLKIEQQEASLQKTNTNIEKIRELLEREDQRKSQEAKDLQKILDRYDFENFMVLSAVFSVFVIVYLVN